MQRRAPAMTAPWMRVLMRARMLKMVCEKMYEPVMPAPVSAVTMLLMPARGVQGFQAGVQGFGVCKKMYEPVMPAPVSAVTMLRMPARGVQGFQAGGSRVQGFRQARTDGLQLLVVVQGVGRVCLDGRDVQAGAEGDHEEQCGHLQDRRVG